MAGETMKDVNVHVGEDHPPVSETSDLEVYQKMLRRGRVFFTTWRTFHRFARQEAYVVTVSTGRNSVNHYFSAEDGLLLDVEPDGI